MYLSCAILIPKQTQAHKDVFLLKCIFEDGLVVPGTYCGMWKSRTIIDILNTKLGKNVLKLFHRKSEVGDVEIKNIVRF